MLRLRPFELHRPTTLEEALDALDGADQPLLIAGGTDLMPKLKRQQFDPTSLISLSDIEDTGGLREVRRGDDGLVIGGMATLATLEAYLETLSAQIKFSALEEAVKFVATPIMRNNATVAGNLLQDTRCRYYDRGAFWRSALGYCLKKDGDECKVAPGGDHCYATLCSDLAPALIVLGAEVTLARRTPRGVEERAIPVESLYRDNGLSHLNMEREILVRVTVPARQSASTYKKLRVRDAFDFPELGIAVSVTEDGERIEASVAVCGVSSDIFVLRESVDRPSIPDLIDRACRAIKPMDALYLPPAHRKRVARNFLVQSFDELLLPR